MRHARAFAHFRHHRDWATRKNSVQMSSAEFSMVHGAPRKTQASLARPIPRPCRCYRQQRLSRQRPHFSAERNRSWPAQHPEADRSRRAHRASTRLVRCGISAQVAFRVLVRVGGMRTERPRADREHPPGWAAIRRNNSPCGYPQIRGPERPGRPRGVHATGSDTAPRRA